MKHWHCCLKSIFYFNFLILSILHRNLLLLTVDSIDLLLRGYFIAFAAVITMEVEHPIFP